MRLMYPLLIALAAVACGGDGSLGPGEKPGTGSVTATGAVSASGSGRAIFQSISSGGTSLFQIVVAPESPASTTWSLQIANYSGRPGVGTYQLSPLSPSSPNPTANFYYVSDGAIEMWNSTSGELVITVSSTTAVRGTFTFTAAGPGSGASSVTAQGSFNAQCAAGFACQ